MKVLIIDDIEDTVKGIVDSCEDHKWECKTSDFDDAYKCIFEFDPDVIILDWREDAENIDVGETVLSNIWRNGFRPLIIFTANAKLLNIDSKLQESNMIKVISKGDEDPVIEQLEALEKFASALELYRKDMGKALITALNSIENMKAQPGVEERAIEYVLSKRTSSFFDKEYVSSLPPAWVQYLCPPVNVSLNVCDVIRIKHKDVNWDAEGQPEEYLLVLTPSCDMSVEGGRTPKVSHVLCAHCCEKEVFHGKGLSSNPKQKNITEVTKGLTAGYNSSKVALPGLTNVIPYLTVDLKKIELVAISEIAINISTINDSDKYVRVASIASPFREQIVWAHMQNSCRPGVPDRNFELWAKEILTI